MSLSDKIERALSVVDLALSKHSRSAVMCSFGKDSMVLLHLVRRIADLPVIFHREALQGRRLSFAHRVIEEWDLSVHDFVPNRTEVYQSGEDLEVVNLYPFGAKTCYLPIRFTDPKPGENFACALNDVYNKPVGAYVYPWTCVFHGHKSSDVDALHGAVPINSDVVNQVDAPTTAFPLRHFTDSDIWEYTEREGIPIHHARYKKVSGVWQEREDKTHNHDFYAGCTACMKLGGGPVPCPRLNGLTVSNISAQLRWAEKPKPAYMET